jgi:hypothetical protein
MPGREFVWFRPLGKFGEEAIDLYACRRFIVKEYEGNPEDTSLAYYCSPDSRWIEAFGYEDITPRSQEYYYVINYRECKPEHVAHHILAHKIYGEDGSGLPEELERYRRYGDKDEYEVWSKVNPGHVVRHRPTEAQPRPIWADKTVTFRGVVCKRFARVAGNQIKILDSFEENNWARCVKSPISGRLELKNTVDSMNDWPDSLISFSQNGIEVCWSPKP